MFKSNTVLCRFPDSSTCITPSAQNSLHVYNRSPTTGLLEYPEEAAYYSWILEDPKNAPYASFCFHYRSMDNLKLLNLLPDSTKSLIASPLQSCVLPRRVRSTDDGRGGYAQDKALQFGLDVGNVGFSAFNSPQVEIAQLPSTSSSLPSDTGQLAVDFASSAQPSSESRNSDFDRPLSETEEPLDLCTTLYELNGVDDESRRIECDLTTRIWVPNKYSYDLVSRRPLPEPPTSTPISSSSKPSSSSGHNDYSVGRTTSLQKHDTVSVDGPGDVYDIIAYSSQQRDAPIQRSHSRHSQPPSTVLEVKLLDQAAHDKSMLKLNEEQWTKERGSPRTPADIQSRDIDQQHQHQHRYSGKDENEDEDIF